jgi:membrane-associated phospholipid phosphatase
MPHNALGEVDSTAYALLLQAVYTGRAADFDAIPLGGAVKFSNPRAAYAFELEGPDSHCLYLEPPPAFASAREASEMAEVYWQALARDVPFAAYTTHPLVSQAAADLSGFTNFAGPKSGAIVTAGTIFRGPTVGDLTGPYLSQFLWAPVAYGPMTIEQRYAVALSTDYMTSYASWLNIQQGRLMLPGRTGGVAAAPRYLSSGRDLATYVHTDFTYQAYLNACLTLTGMGAPLDAGNPYRHARTERGFATFGTPHLLDLVARAANAALKAAWFQKWLVHRRLRPEAFGGRVHNHKTGAAGYPIHQDLLTRSAVLDAVYRKYGSYLLPVSYPEGAPAHPAYPAGHAAVAGACVTVLKAFHDELYVLPRPVVASADGLTLQAYSGPTLTVGGELNKLAANICLGRDFAGVHWRSDATAGMLLGEAVAIGILTDQGATFNERFHGFSLTKFDRTTIRV